MVAAIIPAEELRNLPRAALLGARIVILDAEPRAETRAGWVARMPLRTLREAF
jgi:hypothetical protein